MSETTSTKSYGKYVALIVLVGIPLLLCGGCLTWWFGRDAVARRDLEQKRADLRSRGLPIDDQSLTEFRKERMNQQNSKRWMAALKQLASKEFQDSGSQIPLIGEPKDTSPYVPGQPYLYDAEVSEFLKRWEPLLTEIHDITEGSQGIWTEIEFDSLNTLLPYVQECRTVARLLTLEFEDAVRRDDRDQVFHCLMAKIGTARSLEAEPLIVSQLVHLALMSSVQHKVKQAVALDLLNESQLREILLQLKAVDNFIANFRLTIVGERALSRKVFDNPSQLGNEVPGYVGARAIDALASLEILSKAESIETEDLNDFFYQVTQWEAERSADVRKGGFLRLLDTSITRLIMPACGAYGKAVVRGAMENRIAKLGIGLRIFELRNGRMPNSLDELTSDVTLDLGPIAPSGTRPFGYTSNETTAVLWGFPPQTVNDHTPETPVDPASLSEEHEKVLWEYWLWKLRPKSVLNDFQPMP